MNDNEIDLAQDTEKEVEPTPGKTDALGSSQEQSFPELQINDSTDPALMDLPEHGVSMIHHSIIHTASGTPVVSVLDEYN